MVGQVRLRSQTCSQVLYPSIFKVKNIVKIICFPMHHCTTFSFAALLHPKTFKSKLASENHNSQRQEELSSNLTAKNNLLESSYCLTPKTLPPGPTFHLEIALDSRCYILALPPSFLHSQSHRKPIASMLQPPEIDTYPATNYCGSSKTML
ncbi:hypothetical protein BDR22DRAFT_172399 [Usnea florida]